MNRRIILIIALALIVAVVGGAVLAQQTKARPDKGVKQCADASRTCEKLTKALNLTPAQQTAVKSIMADRAGKIKALKQDPKLTTEQKKAKAREIIEASQARIKSLLTPEQQKKIGEIGGQVKQKTAVTRDRQSKDRTKMPKGLADRKAMKDRAATLGEKARKAAPRFAEALNLTDKQKEQLKPILQKKRDQVKAILQNQKLSADQKKAQVRKLHDDTRAKIARILTPEQRKKFEQMKTSVKRKVQENRTRKPA